MCVEPSIINITEE